MENLDFNPIKGGKSFRENYKLHDLAEYHGKNLLTQWGIDFEDFGKDKRYEKVWEKGKDKPDLIISYKNQKAFLDWKGKHKPEWIVNARAVKSYAQWGEQYNLPVVLCFMIFDEGSTLTQTNFALLSKHKYAALRKKEWDKNEIVEFESDLPKFNKINLLDYLFKFK